MSILRYLFMLVALTPDVVLAQDIEVRELSRPITILGDERTGSHLNRLADLTSGNGDTLYVLDAGDNQVVAFDVYGTELFRFGRGGSGPGEFSRPRAIAFSGQSVFVGDYGLSRVEEFSSRGEYIRSIKMPAQPNGGLVAYQGRLYVGVQSQQSLVLRVPVEHPDEYVHFLTFDHPRFQEFDGMERFRNGQVEMAVGETGLIIAFPSIGGFMFVPWGISPEQCHVIEPHSELIDREWERFADLYERFGGAANMQLFNRVDEWLPGKILLEVRTGHAETFHAIAITVDANTGEELGPRLKPGDAHHGRLCLLKGNKLAWINWGNSTVSIFETNRR